MGERRAVVWCRVRQQRVRVILAEKAEGSEEGLPEGWCIRKCLDERVPCIECPFAILDGQGRETVEV